MIFAAGSPEEVWRSQSHRQEETPLPFYVGLDLWPAAGPEDRRGIREARLEPQGKGLQAEADKEPQSLRLQAPSVCSGRDDLSYHLLVLYMQSTALKRCLRTLHASWGLCNANRVKTSMLAKIYTRPWVLR